MKNARSLLFISLILVAMMSRLIPHAPNFTAVGAAALFAGFAFRGNWKAFLVPLIALWLSDLVLNNLVFASSSGAFTLFTEGFGWIYVGMLMSVLIGSYGVRSFKIVGLLGAGVSSALLFYLLTNFGAWLGNPLYAQSFSGLITSYIAGLPFLANQVLGTIAYGIPMFGAAYFLSSKRSTSGVHA